MRACKFVRWQELKVQELPDQVPVGHIPRMMTVNCVETLTRTCNPGDEVIISGVSAKRGAKVVLLLAPNALLA